MQPNVIIYVHAYSMDSIAVKRFLEETKGVRVQEVDLTGNLEARSELTSRTGVHPLPQIFIGEAHIANYTKLRTMDVDGDLDLLLFPPEEEEAEEEDAESEGDDV